MMKLNANIPVGREPGRRRVVAFILVILLLVGGIWLRQHLISHRVETAVPKPTLSLVVRPNAIGDFLVLSVNGVELPHHLLSLTWSGSPSLRQLASQAELVGRGGNPDGRTTFEVSGRYIVLVYAPFWRNRTGYVEMRLKGANGKIWVIRSPRLTL